MKDQASIGKESPEVKYDRALALSSRMDIKCYTIPDYADPHCALHRIASHCMALHRMGEVMHNRSNIVCSIYSYSMR